MLRALRKTYFRRRNPGFDAWAANMRTADPDAIAAEQLRLLNIVWSDAQRQVPFYAALAAKTRTRDGFESLEHYAGSIPIMEKGHVSNVTERSAAQYDFTRITGGSTGTPVHLPAWSSEHAHAKDALLVGRFWNGISPGDTLCLIWGHSHLLGTGWRGVLNAQVRRAKDLMLGYTRISCYDLSGAALAAISRRLGKLRCDFVLGYARALDALARHKQAQRDTWATGAKAVIATGEALPFDDSREVIEAAFGAPLVMEYGAVETGPIAYTVPGQGFRVFWSKYLIERSEVPGREGEILLTALYPRATPLFRYAIGDRLDGVTQSARGSIIEFDRVTGRSNTPVILPSGRHLHSEVASHVFRAFPAVGQYQLECRCDHVLGRYVAQSDLSEEEVARVRSLSSAIDAEFGETLRLKRCRFEDLKQGASGKIPFVTYGTG